MKLAVKAGYPDKWCFMPSAAQIELQARRMLEYMGEERKRKDVAVVVATGTSTGVMEDLYPEGSGSGEWQIKGY